MVEEERRKLLIITDNTASVLNMAKHIAANLRKPPFSDCLISTLEVAQFSAVDILPAYAFFIGCDNQKAFSFLYIEDLFAHINLAGRPCGIFSSNTVAIRYLSNLVRPCEAVIGKPFIIKDDTVDSVTVRSWVTDIILKRDTDERV